MPAPVEIGVFCRNPFFLREGDSFLLFLLFPFKERISLVEKKLFQIISFLHREVNTSLLFRFASSSGHSSFFFLNIERCLNVIEETDFYLDLRRSLTSFI